MTRMDIATAQRAAVPVDKATPRGPERDGPVDAVELAPADRIHSWGAAVRLQQGLLGLSLDMRSGTLAKSHRTAMNIIGNLKA